MSSFDFCKVKPKCRVRWTGSRSRGRWRYSSNDDSDGSDSEKSSAASEEEGKESEEAVLPEDDEPCKKCGLPNPPELVCPCTPGFGSRLGCGYLEGPPASRFDFDLNFVLFFETGSHC